MANLKDIVATLAILSAGTLTLTGCKKTEGETTAPDGNTDGATDVAPADGGGETEPTEDASCSAEDTGGGEEPTEDASCSAEDGDGSCSGAA